MAWTRLMRRGWIWKGDPAQHLAEGMSGRGEARGLLRRLQGAGLGGQKALTCVVSQAVVGTGLQVRRWGAGARGQNHTAAKEGGRLMDRELTERHGPSDPHPLRLLDLLTTWPLPAPLFLQSAGSGVAFPAAIIPPGRAHSPAPHGPNAMAPAIPRDTPDPCLCSPGSWPRPWQWAHPTLALRLAHPGHPSHTPAVPPILHAMTLVIPQALTLSNQDLLLATLNTQPGDCPTCNQDVYVASDPMPLTPDSCPMRPPSGPALSTGTYPARGHSQDALPDPEHP